VTKEQKIEYIRWIFSECSTPIDEVEYLLDAALETNKQQTITDMALAVLKYRKQND
jgi:hypothetical protein